MFYLKDSPPPSFSLSLFMCEPVCQGAPEFNFLLFPRCFFSANATEKMVFPTLPLSGRKLSFIDGYAEELQPRII